MTDLWHWVQTARSLAGTARLALWSMPAMRRFVSNLAAQRMPFPACRLGSMQLCMDSSPGL